MDTKKRDRPSKFILEVLAGGKRLKSGQIFAELENAYPGRFVKTQIYQSIINLKKSGKIHHEGRLYFTETEATVNKNAVKQWFFRHPNKRIYDSSLAKRLEMSPDSMAEALQDLCDEDFLEIGKSSDFLGQEYELSDQARREIPPTIQNAEAIQDTITDVREQLTELVQQIQSLEEAFLAGERPSE